MMMMIGKREGLVVEILLRLPSTLSLTEKVRH
jgi:hypothetical protein